MPTTVHKSPPNLICRPIWAPKKRFVMPAPTIVSRAPHLNILPAMIRTCGLSCNAASSIPRTVTLLIPSDPIFRRFIITTTSLELMSCPSGDRATCGRLVTIPAASRSMMLMISLDAALRTTVTLSSEPVDFKGLLDPIGHHQDGRKNKHHEGDAKDRNACS